MSSYFTLIEKTSEEQGNDIISLENLEYNIDSNPRSIVTVRKCNGDLQCYPIHILKQLIDNTNKDPLTRKKFSYLTRKRVELYLRGIRTFPNHTFRNIDKKKLFEEWKNTYNPNCILTNREKKLKRLEAQCYLLAEDLTNVFKNFDGDGSIYNRKQAEDLIESRKTLWLIRPSSIESTKNNKVYVLSFVNIYAENGVDHVLILHSFGEGFYYGAQVNVNGNNADDIITNNTKQYTNIIALLQKHVFEHERSKTIVCFD